VAEKFEFRAVFNLNTITYIATNITHVYPDFKTQQFITECYTDFETLSFGARNSKITETLFHYLPQHYPDALHILVSSLGAPISGEELEGYDGFYVMPLSTYIKKYGTQHYDISIAALVTMTTRFTSEWAIRIFLEQEETKTLKSRGLKTDNIIDCEIGQFETFEDLMKFVNSKRTNEQVFIDDIQTMISESVSTKSLKKIPTFITYTFRILK